MIYIKIFFFKFIFLLFFRNFLLQVLNFLNGIYFFSFSSCFFLAILYIQTRYLYTFLEVII